MLVLTRTAQKGIVFHCPDGSIIQVRILRVGSGEVLLGIEAPLSIKILREEMTDAQQLLEGITRQIFDENTCENT